MKIFFNNSLLHCPKKQVLSRWEQMQRHLLLFGLQYVLYLYEQKPSPAMTGWVFMGSLRLFWCTVTFWDIVTFKLIFCSPGWIYFSAVVFQTISCVFTFIIYSTVYIYCRYWKFVLLSSIKERRLR